MKTCAECFYFEKVPLEAAGMCYGNPPLPVVHPSGALASVRPPVKAESRECGRFADRFEASHKPSRLPELLS